MLRKYTDVELAREINAVITAERGRDALIDPTRVALRVCLKHRAALADDEESVHVAFFLYTSYTTVRKQATRCINALDPETQGEDDGPAPPSSAWLPGFEVRFLQAVYVIERSGVRVGVPVEQLTDAELEAKAAHYRAMARQEVAHAAEILRYRDWRREQQAQTSDDNASTRPQATP